MWPVQWNTIGQEKIMLLIHALKEERKLQLKTNKKAYAQNVSCRRIPEIRGEMIQGLSEQSE